MTFFDCKHSERERVRAVADSAIRSGCGYEYLPRFDQSEAEYEYLSASLRWALFNGSQCLRGGDALSQMTLITHFAVRLKFVFGRAYFVNYFFVWNFECLSVCCFESVFCLSVADSQCRGVSVHEYGRRWGEYEYLSPPDADAV